MCQRPVFDLGGTVSLASVLEPVADLCRREASRCRQFALVTRWRVCVACVPVPQRSPRSVLEAVWCLLAVPDRPWQRVLATDAVLADGAEWPTSTLLGLHVMCSQPQRLLTVAHSRHIATNTSTPHTVAPCMYVYQASSHNNNQTECCQN